MKKKLLLAVCILAVVIGGVTLSVTAASNTKTAYCQACKADVTWEPIKYGAVAIPEGETTVHKHYYATADTSTTAQIIAKAGVSVCIDLNGKDLIFPGGRAFLVYEATAVAPAAISIQDSVGGATVTSHSHNKGGDYNSSTNNGTGGVAWVADYCTMNIYGGTYSVENQTPENNFTTAVGIVAVYPGGTLNMYGGTFNGTAVKTQGGAIDVQARGKVNLYGGVVKNGSAPTGNCINVRDSSSCMVTLSGSAQVDDIYYASNNTAALTVSGAFTGKANITYKTDVSLAEGTAIGTLTNDGSITGGDLYCTNGYSVTADGTSLKLAAPSAADVRYECPHCKSIVKWEVFTTTAPTTAGTYHYYLDKDYTTSTSKQYTINVSDIQVCLDLQGHSYTTAGRALNLSASGDVISVIDTKGGGSINGSSGSNNAGGGTVSLSAGTTLNIYNGTLTFTMKSSSLGTGRGGVISASGATVNVYGGKIVGGEMVVSSWEFSGINGAGGAIYAYNTSTLNIQGGEITSGKVPETGAGPCIYVADKNTKVTLGGNAKVADLYFVQNTPSRFTVDGGYTGTAKLSYDPTVEVSQGTAVAVCAADELSGIVDCGSYTALPEDGYLVLSAYPAGTVAATGGQGYTSLQAAVDAATPGGLVEMIKSHTGDIAVSKKLHLQMNSCNINGTVTVAEGATLYGMDSATVDFTVADGKYGKIQQVVGAYAGASTDGGCSDDSYLAVEETDGVSFHCVRLKVYAMSLRVDGTDDKQEPGLYYKSHFLADEKAAPKLASYGVALSIVDTPRESNLETACKYTTFTGFESGPYGNLGNSSSTLLKGIMKTTNTDVMNKRNMNIQIHGRAYAKTTDGQYLFGKTVYRTLGEQLDSIDGVVSGLSKVQTKAVVKLFNKFKGILENRASLQNIATAAANDEAGTLKVLLLGNSHGLDATNLLYEVFYQEQMAGNHDQDVVIAALYYGGCQVVQHKTHISGNQQVYTYHKNDGSQPNRAWVVKDATVLDALRDEQWDIILMQQMNTNAGKESDYKAADWKYVADYLLNNQDIQPKLGFHVTWANPDDYDLFLNDNAPYNIQYISTYSDPTSWRNNHEKAFPDANGKYEMDVMYEKVMELTQKYLLDATDFMGKDYFDDEYMMQSATAIQYAYKVCGREQLDLYRDYTHMSDYGRLIVAYQWYAQLMELEEITEVNTDIIPSNLRHEKSKYPTLPTVSGDSVIDDDMKADLIESVNWALKNPWNIPESE